MVWSYNGNDTAQDGTGNVLSGRTFTVWTAETGGTQLTSTVRNWAGSTVSGGQITSETDGRIRFKETSDTYKVLWLKAPDNNMYPVPALEAIGTGSGGGGVSLSANNTWTGVQSFNGGLSVPDNSLTIADTAGLTTALADRVNPVYKGVVANEAAMLALSAKAGDSVKRSDTGTFWFLWSGTNPATLSNWVELGGAGGSFTPTYANALANSTFTIVVASSATRPSARTDLVFLWLTTDGISPTNKAGNDIWLNALEG